ncbi:FliM/FliN family flagellar motor switch protein [Rheinheimera sp.]|uniref:FliM/FliN family flagellar motor switch protein n=1 Tax=Rheinheimera sp. TaxID=1869214 RepID=UPI0027BA106A|nr:FliM/FliN family flagellar motor switch protein [Rheinheimera sp.]
MSSNKPQVNKLLKGEQAAVLQPYALTAQQRHFEMASQVARSKLTDYGNALQVELGRMLRDVEFSLDVNLCSSVGLEQWLAEPGVLLLDSTLPLEKDLVCYMSIDFQAVHNMADLCLGGQLGEAQSLIEKVELSSSELRISCRLLQKQTQVLMQSLFNQHLPISAYVYKQQLQFEPYAYMPFKVRFILDNTVVSWFIWLPVELFLADSAGVPQYEPPLPQGSLLTDWERVPVQAHIEMARKQVTVQQLEGWLQGAVLPLELFSDMPFRLGKQTLFYGVVAEEGNQLMFQISTIAESK